MTRGLFFLNSVISEFVVSQGNLRKLAGYVSRYMPGVVECQSVRLYFEENGKLWTLTELSEEIVISTIDEKSQVAYSFGTG